MLLGTGAKQITVGQYRPLLGRTRALFYFSKWDLTAGFSFHSVFCLCSRKTCLHWGSSPLMLREGWKFFPTYESIEL